MMILKNFKTYNLALLFYKECQDLKLPYFLKDQMQRAASSIVLNLAEGSAKLSSKERIRFYSISFASLREVQSIIQITDCNNNTLFDLSDQLGACLYRLTHPK